MSAGPPAIKYRKELLQSGVTLYELKPGVGVPPRERRRPEVWAERQPLDSAASLHAKTFAVDRNRIFVSTTWIRARRTSTRRWA
jgi:putative cardiolipin synthase